MFGRVLSERDCYYNGERNEKLITNWGYKDWQNNNIYIICSEEGHTSEQLIAALNKNNVDIELINACFCMSVTCKRTEMISTFIQLYGDNLDFRLPLSRALHSDCSIVKQLLEHIEPEYIDLESASMSNTDIFALIYENVPKPIPNKIIIRCIIQSLMNEKIDITKFLMQNEHIPEPSNLLDKTFGLIDYCTLDTLKFIRENGLEAYIDYPILLENILDNEFDQPEPGTDSDGNDMINYILEECSGMEYITEDIFRDQISIGNASFIEKIMAHGYQPTENHLQQMFQKHIRIIRCLESYGHNIINMV